jgi:protein phosphatase
MKTFSTTHKGLVRADNQDRFLVREFSNGAVLLGVADGAGGEAEGERAAEIARQSLINFDPGAMDIRAHLIESMQAADWEITEIVKRRPEFKGMGSTLTAAFVRKGVVYWAHVGDSRLYLFREGELTQVTEDDTMAGFLLTEGEISKEEARVHPGRNMLFECIGCGGFEAETGSFRLEEGDLLLLTTDGLHDKITEETMVSILLTESELRDKLEALVAASLEASGRDNATVVGMEVDPA